MNLRCPLIFDIRLSVDKRSETSISTHNHQQLIQLPDVLSLDWPGVSVDVDTLKDRIFQ